MGRSKKVRPDETERRTVEAMALAGYRAEDIAEVLGCCRDTVFRHYGEALKTHSQVAIAKVAQTLFRIALDGNPAACMFILKCRARWKETAPEADDKPQDDKRFVLNVTVNGDKPNATPTPVVGSDSGSE